MIVSIIARKTGKKPDEIKLPTTRIPVRPVPAGVLVGEMDEE